MIYFNYPKNATPLNLTLFCNERRIMYRCAECNEESAYEYSDRYDDEIYIKCRICGTIQKKPVCRLCGETLAEGEYAFMIEKEIYCTDCVKPVAV